MSLQARMKADALPFLGLAAYLTLVKILISGFFPDSFRSVSQTAVFAWPILAAVTAAGLLGVVLSRRVGIPSLLDPRVSSRDRYVLPSVIASVLAIVAIVTDYATGWTADAARQMRISSIHIPFPASVLIYPGGAIIVDVIYYLLPIPLLVWIISKGILRGRGNGPVFWAVGLLCALIEPLTQDLGMRSQPMLMPLLIAEDFSLNAAQVYVFRRSGFLAAVVLRTVFYLGWHVIWGPLSA